MSGLRLIRAQQGARLAPVATDGTARIAAIVTAAGPTEGQ